MLFFITLTANIFLSFRKSLVAFIMGYISCLRKHSGIFTFQLKEGHEEYINQTKMRGIE